MLSIRIFIPAVYLVDVRTTFMSIMKTLNLLDIHTDLILAHSYW